MTGSESVPFSAVLFEQDGSKPLLCRLFGHKMRWQWVSGSVYINFRRVGITEPVRFCVRCCEGLKMEVRVPSGGAVVEQAELMLINYESTEEPDGA